MDDVTKKYLDRLSESHGSKYYVLKGREIVKAGLGEWSEFFQNIENRRIAETFVGDVRISTVFLGIDHGFSFEGPPILFETMIFGGKHDQYQDRYATYTEAEAGHARAVALVKGEITE